MAEVTKSHGRKLLGIARKAIEEALKHKAAEVQAQIRRKFSSYQAVFVTLLKDGELRGSMGYAEGIYPLVDGVIKAARDAAFNDPRFKPVRKNELPKLKLRIDILSKFTPASMSKIKTGRDGVYIEYGLFRGLQLPEDAKGFTPKQAVENTLRKAGLAPEMRKDKNVKIYRFTSKALQE